MKDIQRALMRVILPIVITVVLFVMTIFLFIMPFQKASLMERKRETIRKLTEAAWSTLTIYEAKEKSGILSGEQARDQAAEHIRKLRYGQNMQDYFWISNMQFRMIMHPSRRDLEGKDFLSLADPNGKYIFKELMETVNQKKAGYVSYLWQRDPNRIVPKLSYVKVFEPWGWVIGTGLYLEDVHAEITAITRKLIIICLIIFVIIVILSTYVIWQGIRYENERKRFHRVLRDSEKRFRTIIENSGDIIYRTDPNGFITYINQACECLIGYKQEELLGSFFLDIIAPSHRELAMSLRQKQWNEQTLSAYQEQKMLTKSGEERWISQMTSLQVNEGRVDGYQAIVRDIHEKKCAEQEILHAKDAAEEATKAKSQFLANMSHEIRTPLNGIVGMANLLSDTELTTEQYEYVDILLNSSDTLLELINDILDYSKIEAGKLFLEPIPFDLHTVMEETLDMLAPRADEKGIEIILRYVPGVARRFTGDAGRIRQILLNLVNNAIKFTERGHVLVNVECEETGHNHMLLRISVEDTGIGIPGNKLEHIFRHFSQADASTTRKYGGSGLGLAITKQLVDLMDGTISVKSKLGEGSLFSFTLPLLPGPAPDVSGDSAKPELKNLRILIVDDNSVNRRILEEYLAKLELPCDSAASGKESLVLLRAAHDAGVPYNIVLMDYLMPEMNGEVLARNIKADSEIAGTVLIMLTSAAQRGDVQRMANAGISAYIVKPVRDSQLAEILSSAWTDWTDWTDWNREIPAGGIITSCTQRKPVSSKKEAEEISLILGTRVLLVEDNVANQKAGAWMLEKIGCHVDTAFNGLEGIKKLGESSYDIVFMDLQMPEMDGYEAAKEIRTREKASEFRLPIIAMTANVMKDSREECMEVGMDDYISKPVRKDELMKILLHWLKLKKKVEYHSEKTEQSAQSEEPESLVFNSEDALSRYDREVDILKEIIDDYLYAAPDQLKTVRSSLEEEDLTATSEVAHSLKGGASYIGAERLRDVASEIEIASKAGELVKTRELFEIINIELELFQKTVENFYSNYSATETAADNRELKKTQKIFEDIKKELEFFK
ncbi:MAG: response regulator [Desulfobacteraceae bacterium]|nr:response regulator [Desulfobacteraceae bacterium]